MQTVYIHIIIIILFIIICSYQSRENFNTPTPSPSKVITYDTLKTSIYDVYQADVRAIQNLATLAQQLQNGGLTISNDLIVKGELKIFNTNNNNLLSFNTQANNIIVHKWQIFNTSNPPNLPIISETRDLVFISSNIINTTTTSKEILRLKGDNTSVKITPNTTIDGTLNVLNDTILKGVTVDTLKIKGSTQSSQSLNVTGNTTLQTTQISALTVTGNTTLQKLIVNTLEIKNIGTSDKSLNVTGDITYSKNLISSGNISTDTFAIGYTRYKSIPIENTVNNNGKTFNDDWIVPKGLWIIIGAIKITTASNRCKSIKINLSYTNRTIINSNNIKITTETASDSSINSYATTFMEIFTSTNSNSPVGIFVLPIDDGKTPITINYANLTYTRIA